MFGHAHDQAEMTAYDGAFTCFSVRTRNSYVNAGLLPKRPERAVIRRHRWCRPGHRARSTGYTIRKTAATGSISPAHPVPGTTPSASHARAACGRWRGRVTGELPTGTGTPKLCTRDVRLPGDSIAAFRPHSMATPPRARPWQNANDLRKTCSAPPAAGKERSFGPRTKTLCTQAG